MSGAETARRPGVQRRIGGAQTAALKWHSPINLYSMANCKKSFEPVMFLIKLPLYTKAVRYVNGFCDGIFSGYCDVYQFKR